MKKKDFAKSKNLSKIEGKFEQANKGLPTRMRRIITIFMFLILIVPVNKKVLADKDIKPGKKQATLILSDGRKILLNTSKDTIINIEAINLRIKIDSTGINYMLDDKETSNHSKKESVKKKNDIKSI